MYNCWTNTVGVNSEVQICQGVQVNTFTSIRSVNQSWKIFEFQSKNISYAEHKLCTSPIPQKLGSQIKFKLFQLNSITKCPQICTVVAGKLFFMSKYRCLFEPMTVMIASLSLMFFSLNQTKNFSGSCNEIGTLKEIHHENFAFQIPL